MQPHEGKVALLVRPTMIAQQSVLNAKTKYKYWGRCKEEYPAEMLVGGPKLVGVGNGGVGPVQESSESRAAAPSLPVLRNDGWLVWGGEG